ncbi:MAG: CDP-glycerol glycerophosphotransferase family protein, partial [Anaeroplasmataceae bacterium]|nr:CDP-glycerol glycerophosphotransferase family protein [Anaeroplasmataceae bacterium]
LYIFPIKKNRIFIFSYKGTQYSCNPKHISEYLTHNYPNKFQIVWAFKKKKKFKFLKANHIKVVSYFSLARLYYQVTAKVCINNIGSYAWLPLRKKQLHLNTWHGGGAYKRCALGEVNNSNLIKKSLRISAKETNCFISSCETFTSKALINDFDYFGKVLNVGLPRNDCFFDSEYILTAKNELRNLYNIKDEIVILYAPTWRYDKYNDTINPNVIIKALESKYDKKVKFLYRSHHLGSDIIHFEFNESIINVTSYHDMQKLLCLADILITDYSSCIWDFCLMDKPVYLFAPDALEYQKERGFHLNYFEYGFEVAKDTKELCENILNDTLEDALERSKKHKQLLGSYEKGDATKQTVKYIIDWIDGK